MYICDFSRSVGAGSATTRKTRGLTRSVIALIVPPLPAVSRPSKTMQTFAPGVLDPFLHRHQLAVQPPQLALVRLALHGLVMSFGVQGKQRSAQPGHVIPVVDVTLLGLLLAHVVPPAFDRR